MYCSSLVTAAYGCFVSGSLSEFILGYCLPATLLCFAETLKNWIFSGLNIGIHCLVEFCIGRQYGKCDLPLLI
jgi:hypothetical protein